MKKFFLRVLLVLVWLGVKGAGLAESPKEVALAFAKALSAGDKKGMRELCVGSEEHAKTAEVLSDLVVGMEKFKKACVARWGPGNALSKGMSGDMPDLVALVQGSEVKVEGERATVVNTGKPDAKDPLKLKLVEGKWKVDLDSMGKDAAGEALKLQKIIKVLGEMADEIAQGKFPTEEAAGAAFGGKMMKAGALGE